MTTYTAITTPQVSAGASLNTALMTALRDNVLAIQERDPSAPKVIGADFSLVATADAANDATIDFTGFDATKYDAYMFVFANVIPATDSVNLTVRTSSNGGATYDSGATDYGYVIHIATDAGVASAAGSAGASSSFLTANVGSAANEDGVTGVLYLAKPDLTKRTLMRGSLTFYNSVGQLSTSASAGSRISSASVNAIRFLFASGNVESGTITMYGMWNS